MADLLFACQRPGHGRPPSHEDLLRVAARLAPDDIAPRPALVLDAPGAVTLVANPSPDGVRTHDGSVCLGGLFGGPGEWWRVDSAAPDGTYALLRVAERRVELLTDAVASRPLWYVLDDERFLAATSQRALIAVLGRLDVDPVAVSWLLSSGTLGPESSYDTRIRRLPGCSRLTLDRETWTERVETADLPFEPVERSDEAHVAALREALDATCANLGIDVGQWVLPLSGGRDSRTLLAFMVRNGSRPRCVTWTTRASVRRPLSDAFIARLVARRFAVEHEFTWLDGDDARLAASLDRFVAAVEGCSDAYSGYTDGCRTWRELFDDGVSGVIRGDESAAIRRGAASPAAARAASGGAMVADYPATHVIHRLGLGEQDWPERLRQRPGEALHLYRARMYEQVRLPTVLAPLNALKARYVEVINPLLSRRVLDAVHELPDDLRAYGRAYSRAVDPESRPIPYAKSTSVAEAADYLDDSAIVEEIVRELSSPRIEAVLSREEAVVDLLATVASPDWRRRTLRDRAHASLRAGRSFLPVTVGRRLTPPYAGPDPLSPVQVAFRAAIASKTIALLRDDATLSPGGPGRGSREAQ